MMSFPGLRTRVKSVESASPGGLAREINLLQDSCRVFATQTHYDPDAKEWVAFVFYREEIPEEEGV